MTEKEKDKDKASNEQPKGKLIPHVLNSSIVKANRLIQAKYKGGIVEEKIVYAALLAAQNRAYKETSDGYEVLLTSRELKKMTGYKGGSFYEKLKPAAASLVQRVYCIDDPENKSFSYINLITECSYDDGELRIVFNKKQEELLMNLKSNFTKLPTLMMNLKNVYAFRLYEILKSECYYTKDVPEEQRNGVFLRSHSIAELKLALGVVDANNRDTRMILASNNPDFDRAVEKTESRMYKSTGDFVSYVIDRAVEEINEKLDIHISYEKIRVKRQIHDIEFTISLNKKNQEEPSKNLSEAERLAFNFEVAKLFDNTLGVTEIIDVAKASDYNMDKLKEIKKAIDESTTEISNPVGFILTALKNGYKFKQDDEKEVSTISPDVLKKTKRILGDDYEEEDILSIISAAEGDVKKIKAAREVLDLQKHVTSKVGFLISAIKNGYKVQKSYGKSGKAKRGIENEEFDADEFLRQQVLKGIRG